MGRPSLFIRLAGCNRHCNFCDTKYANNARCILKTDEVAKIITDSHYKHIVWTGGEPALQIDEIYDVIKKTKGHLHDIETNGTIYFDTEPFDIIAVSPKDRPDNVIPDDYYTPLRNFAETSAIFKTVVKDRSEVYKTYLILNQMIGIRPSRIWIMLEHTRWSWFARRKTKELIEECKLQGFYFSPRLHIMIYGKKRGV